MVFLCQAKESIEQLVYLCRTDKEDVRDAAKQALLVLGTSEQTQKKKTIKRRPSDQRYQPCNKGFKFQSFAAVWLLFFSLCTQVRRGRWPIGMSNRMESLDYLRLAAWPALHFKHHQPAETLAQRLLCTQTCIHASEGLMIKHRSHCWNANKNPITSFHSVRNICSQWTNESDWLIDC